MPLGIVTCPRDMTGCQRTRSLKVVGKDFEIQGNALPVGREDDARIHHQRISADRFFEIITNLTQEFEGFRILGPKIAIIMELYRGEKEGFIHSLTSLSREVEIPHATMLGHLRDMIENGWIQRVPSQEDRRMSYVRLIPNIIEKIRRALNE